MTNLLADQASDQGAKQENQGPTRTAAPLPSLFALQPEKQKQKATRVDLYDLGNCIITFTKPSQIQRFRNL